MADHAYSKESFKRWIAYVTLLCFVFASQQPSKLNAEDCTCVLVDQQDNCRAKTAMVVAGVTVIALVGGIAYLACGTRGHKHSHSSSSSSSSYDPPFSSYSYSYDSDYSPDYSYSYSYSGDSYGRHHHHDHNHHHHSNRSSDYSSDNSFFYENEGSGRAYYHSKADPQIFERNDGGNFPARTRKLKGAKKRSESDEISGNFTTHPSLSASGKGSVTAFVQLPDGTTQVLGSLPFSSSAGSSLSYGPFTQKGNYVFGMTVDEGTSLSSQTKVGSVEINVNGSTVESRDFFAPAHAPSHYEPSPCEYAL